MDSLEISTLAHLVEYEWGLLHLEKNMYCIEMSIPAVFKKKFKNMSSNLAHPCSFHLCAEQRTGFLQSIDHSLCLWRYALSILRGTAARDGQSRLRRLAFFLRMGNCTYMYLWTWKLSYYIIFIFLLYTIVTWHNFWCEQFERKKTLLCML